jgi:hypothetical protein
MCLWVRTAQAQRRRVIRGVGLHEEMAILNAYQHVFPVVAGDRSADGRVLLIDQVLGTAFPIGGNFWITAAHVLKGANALGFLEGTDWRCAQIERREVADSYDVGLFEVTKVTGTPVPWIERSLPMSEAVLAVGFPYALNRNLNTVSARAFRGSVVAPAITTKIPAKPLVYELQFQCPRGLSGAPLLHEDTALFVAGMVVGNAATEMMVLADREVLKDGSTSIVERYEMLQLGIAIQTSSILSLKFEALGKSVGEHLKSLNLLK